MRLIFTCCHPSLSEEARIALTLREVCGLATEEIARAFLTTPSTLAQRIVRAKAKIRDAAHSLPGAEPDQFAPRLASVLRVVYLVFNEGYSASSGEQALRLDLAAEAIRLGWLLVRAPAPKPRCAACWRSCCCTTPRRTPAPTRAGDLVPLEEQDRSLWDASETRNRQRHGARALRAQGFGPYALQAAIVAVHPEAKTVATTDWAQIAGLDDRLLRLAPSAVVELNRAVAIAMRDGPEAGLVKIEPMLTEPPLATYRLTHAAYADLCRRAGRIAEARILVHARPRPLAAGTGATLPAPPPCRPRHLTDFPARLSNFRAPPFDQ